MSQNYKIVERLKAGRTHSSLGIQMAPSALEVEAASLIQELGEAINELVWSLLREGGVTSPDYVMVPREPTKEMLIAAGTVDGFDAEAVPEADNAHIAWWKIMLSAAPPSPRSDDGSGLDAVNAERAAIAAQVEYCAEQYSPHSDGRNTFTILADWIRSRMMSTPHSTAVSAIGLTPDVVIEEVTTVFYEALREKKIGDPSDDWVADFITRLSERLAMPLTTSTQSISEAPGAAAVTPNPPEVS